MKRIITLRVISLSLFLFTASLSIAQTQPCADPSSADCCPGYSDLKQVKRPGVTFPGTPYFNGLLEYTPVGYDPGGSALYPVIIYFHGLGETGFGTNADLCQILTLIEPANTDNNPFNIPLPERIERGEVPTVSFGGNTYNYIIISPQYNSYNYPSAYPTAPDVAAVINYVVANYKVDLGRIYLTGMSSGANLVMEYAAASAANAARIAGIAMASLCSTVGNFPAGPANIGNTDLAVWALHCITDDFPGGACPDTLVNNWITKINAFNPTPLAKKTTLGPSGPRTCNTGFTHDTWTTFYDPTFVIDGLNIYQWFIQYSRLQGSPLPASIKNYNAVLRGSKVYVEWTTTAESNTDRFVLERANANMQYQEIASVTAAGVSGGEKKYVLIDEQPMKGANLYRLSLINRDGQREYYDIKRVSLPVTGQGVHVNIPVPVKGTMAVYVNVERAQNVRITVHDLHGKQLHLSNKMYAPGLSENRIDVTALARGTYFVKVAGENFSVTKKVVVN
ncbi:MAG TPA: T9SS type A sorting domain-containing protein [Chitinophagaceae bacterium]